MSYWKGFCTYFNAQWTNDVWSILATSPTKFSLLLPMPIDHDSYLEILFNSVFVITFGHRPLKWLGIFEEMI